MRPSSATDRPTEVQSLSSPSVGLNPNSHSGGGQVAQQPLLGGAVRVQNEPSMNHTVQIQTDTVESITTREITEQEIRALIQDPNVSIRTTVEHTVSDQEIALTVEAYSKRVLNLQGLI